MSPRAQALLAVVLLGAAAGRGHGSEDAAVAALTKLGGTVRRDVKAPGMPILAVDLSASRVTDEDLKHLKHVASLQWLFLQATAVTDVGLKHLQDLSKTCLEMILSQTNNPVITA